MKTTGESSEVEGVGFDSPVGPTLFESERIIIKEMPTKETLEKYLAGLFGRTTVYFSLEEGKFIDKEQDGIGDNPEQISPVA